MSRIFSIGWGLLLFCGSGFAASDCGTDLENAGRAFAILSAPSDRFLGALPYDRYSPELFEPALNEGLRLAKLNFNHLLDNSDAPTYENTILALEAIEDPLRQIQSVFRVFLSVNQDPTLEKTSETFAPTYTRFSTEVYSNPKLFARVEALYNQGDNLPLTAEQKVVLRNTHRAFVATGARLAAPEQKRIREINARLSVLSNHFKRNVLDSRKAFEWVVTDRAELAGLPVDRIEAAGDLSKRRGKTGEWIFTLDAPSYLPVLKFADNASLREKLWRAAAGIATTGKTDNRPVLLEMAQLRLERARLLGFKTHAHFVTENRMAKNPETVLAFLHRLAAEFRPQAEKEFAELKAFAGGTLRPWDVAYFSEKLRSQEYSYHEEELRSYLSFDRVVEGVFYVAGQLHGVRFVPRPELPVWHSSVRPYEVQAPDGKSIALFYLDPFPRPSKRAGAFMTELRGGGEFAGVLHEPHVINVSNVTPPGTDRPALLNLAEVKTIFHELGHGLNSMLSKVRAPSLAGTSVAWDAVEIASKILENWATRPEVLDVYARHYLTGERIPEALVEKVRRAGNFQAAYSGLLQVGSSMLDLAWHARDLDGLTVAGVDDWEVQALADFRFFPRTPGTSLSASFTHIFPGGYSAGHYTYDWCDMYASDGFELFEELGIFHRPTAQKFRAILEAGGTQEMDVLYRLFRGRDPDPEAILRSRGLR